MTAVIRSEFRKVTSTSLWWILALAVVAYVGFMAAVIGFSVTIPMEEGGLGGEDVDPVRLASVVYGIAASIGYVFPLVMGALSVTSEYRHRTVTATFLAVPQRGRVLAAKLVVQAAFGALYGVLGTLTAVAVGAGAFAIADIPPSLDSGEVWTAIVMSVVALTVWGMIGVGFGALVRNQVTSIVGILAFTQFLEPILRVGLMAAGDPVAVLSKFLPGAAAEAMVGASFYSVGGMVELLDRWAGVLVMVTYALVFALVGWFANLRRDVS